MTRLLILLLALCCLASSAQTFSTNTLLLKRRPGLDERLFTDLHGKHKGRNKAYRNLPGWEVVRLPNARSARAAYFNSGLFEKVQPDQRIRLNAVPNDPMLAQQWAVQKISMPQAWDRYTGSSVVVAVVDTGIAFNHPDLAANLWTGPDGEHGYTCIGGVVVPGGMDDNVHGTHVAGIIGASGDNGVGIAGINWRIQLLSLKFLDNTGSGWASDAGLAIDKMISLKQSGVNVRLANHSWSSDGINLFLREAFQRCEDAGILSVAAAGNNGRNTDALPLTPGSLDNAGIITVKATDATDAQAWFSNYGLASTDLSAPGVNIISTIPDGYEPLGGTSMATPHVCGVLAAAFALNPSLTPFQVKDILLSPESLDFPTNSGNADLDTTGGGRLNMLKLVSNPRLFAPTASNRPPVITLNTATNLIIVQPGVSYSVTASASDPDGDECSFAAQMTALDAFQDLYELIGTRYYRRFEATNSLSVTPAAVALDIPILETFTASDRHGSVASTQQWLFCYRDESKLRSISNSITGWRIWQNPNNPSEGWHRLDSTDTNLIYQFQPGWAFASGFSPVNRDNRMPVFVPPLEFGPFNARARVYDEWGNYHQTEASVIGTPISKLPSIQVSFNTTRGVAPLEVIADMSRSYPGDGTNQQYVWRYLGRTINYDDPSNPVQRFTLEQPGVYLIEVDIIDVQRGLFDRKVEMITVLPGLPEPEPPPAPVLVAPTDLTATGNRQAVTLRWSDASTGEDRWEIQSQSKAKGPWTAWTTLAVLPPDSRQFAFIPSASAYKFRVKACIDSVCSGFSNEVQFKLK